MLDKLLHSVVAAAHAGGHRLHLRFDDGTEGDVDLRRLVRFRGLLGPLRDPAYVALVRVEPEQGTVTWPNGADLDEVVLYCAVRGIPVPTYDDARPRSPKAPPSGDRRHAVPRARKGARRAGA